MKDELLFDVKSDPDQDVPVLIILNTEKLLKAANVIGKDLLFSIFAKTKRSD